MRYDGAYKTYKLYSVTEQDIAVTGGNGASRYINNTVLVFLKLSLWLVTTARRNL